MSKCPDGSIENRCEVACCPAACGEVLSPFFLHTRKHNHTQNTHTHTHAHTYTYTHTHTHTHTHARAKGRAVAMAASCEQVEPRTVAQAISGKVIAHVSTTMRPATSGRNWTRRRAKRARKVTPYCTTPTPYWHYANTLLTWVAPWNINGTNRNKSHFLFPRTGGQAQHRVRGQHRVHKFCVFAALSNSSFSRMWLCPWMYHQLCTLSMSKCMTYFFPGSIKQAMLLSARRWSLATPRHVAVEPTTLTPLSSMWFKALASWNLRLKIGPCVRMSTDLNTLFFLHTQAACTCFFLYFFPF
jgi:hypothetical protein